MADRSQAKRLAVEVRNQLASQLGDRAYVLNLWHPSFANKKDLENTIVNVRPIQRSRARNTPVAESEIVLEIGIIQKLPPPAADSADPFNLEDTIDGLDDLGEVLFTMFCNVDPSVYGTPAGVMTDTDFEGYQPGKPEQPSTVNSQLLESDRIFLSVLKVPYVRMD